MFKTHKQPLLSPTQQTHTVRANLNFSQTFELHKFIETTRKYRSLQGSIHTCRIFSQLFVEIGVKVKRKRQD